MSPLKATSQVAVTDATVASRPGMGETFHVPTGEASLVAPPALDVELLHPTITEKSRVQMVVVRAVSMDAEAIALGKIIQMRCGAGDCSFARVLSRVERGERGSSSADDVQQPPGAL